MNWPHGLFAAFKRLTVTDPTTLESAVDTAERDLLLRASEDDGMRHVFMILLMHFSSQDQGDL